MSPKAWLLTAFSESAVSLSLNPVCLSGRRKIKKNDLRAGHNEMGSEIKIRTDNVYKIFSLDAHYVILPLRYTDTRHECTQLWARHPRLARSIFHSRTLPRKFY